jgi:hypothetical protein
MMQSETYIDKSDWPLGPWDDEPDRVQWQHESGLPCIVNRAKHTGALCGYVGVRAGHPLYELARNDESPALAAALERRKGEPIGATPGLDIMVAALSGDIRPTPALALRVHGGITHAGRIQFAPDDVWWFGFDCGHYGDLCPTGLPWLGGEGDCYCDLDYVRAEVDSLARQLAAMVTT